MKLYNTPILEMKGERLHASFPLYTGKGFVNAPENNMIGLCGFGLR